MITMQKVRLMTNSQNKLELGESNLLKRLPFNLIVSIALNINLFVTEQYELNIKMKRIFKIIRYCCPGFYNSKGDVDG